MSSFYATTSSSVSTIEPSLPPPPQTKHQPYVPSAVRQTRLDAGLEVAGRSDWRSRDSRRRYPAVHLRPSKQLCASESYPPPASHRHRHHLPNRQPSLSHRACSCIPSHHPFFLPMLICFRRHLLALICFAPIPSYVISVPFLLRIRIHRFVFFLRSGLLLALAGSATPASPRLAMPISPSLRLDYLLSRNSRSPLCIHSHPSKLTYLTPTQLFFVSPRCSHTHHPPQFMARRFPPLVLA